MPTTIETDTPRTGNEGAYKLEELEPAASGSRFALRKNSEGRTVRPAEAVAGAWTILAEGRVDQAKPNTPDLKTVPLFFVSRNEQRAVVRVPRGKVTRIPELEVARSGKFRKPAKEIGSALLDRFFLEPEFDVRDEAVWDALETTLTELDGLDGASISEMNDAVCTTLLARAGIKLRDRFELPAIGAPH